MNVMTEEELRHLLDSEDCYLIMRNRTRRTGDRRTSVDLIAQRKDASKEQVYLTTRRLLPILTEEEIRRKLGVAS
jgi:hypothetical protein